MESEKQKMNGAGLFQMPLHYPRYTVKDYSDMPDWKLDKLLDEYGLSANGAFLWPVFHSGNQKPPAYYGY
ncbi:hypothetical protein HRI_001745300 [Hibiscus trionum]|uniref:DUF7722 domain-containing protein n=1 Tax=Hibiscus trionum TaxID=183268 RepID=A0A9W7HMV6_HIBTR|nr:hypothetical protein HRI_001745300 [Hibiscus trionum]